MNPFQSEHGFQFSSGHVVSSVTLKRSAKMLRIILHIVLPNAFIFRGSSQLMVKQIATRDGKHLNLFFEL